MLEKAGWQQMRQSGSHRQFRHPERPDVITIPGNPGDVLALGTEARILKKAGLKKK